MQFTRRPELLLDSLIAHPNAQADLPWASTDIDTPCYVKWRSPLYSLYRADTKLQIPTYLLVWAAHRVIAKPGAQELHNIQDPPARR